MLVTTVRTVKGENMEQKFKINTYFISETCVQNDYTHKSGKI